MKKTFILITAFALSPLAFTSPSLFSKAAEMPIDEAQKNKPMTIKVLLQEEQNKALLEVKGPFKVFCPHSNVLVSSYSTAKRQFCKTEKSGLFWGDSFPGTFGIRIVPTNSHTTILIDGSQYKGCVEVYDINGKLRIINEVDVENYLRSCLATECFQVHETEVLNSLAIVARTNAYHQVHQFPEAPWHVVAKDVGYQGNGNTLQYFPLEQAIIATRHAILTYQDKPFAASWSENAGGKTASFSSIHSTSTPTPKGVSIEGMETERLKSSWSFQVSKQELAKIAQLAKVANIALFSEKDSGKVYAIKVSDDISTKTLDFSTLQTALGKAKLKSNDFTLEVLDQAIRFKGFGSGNGVGLCLHTARLMAKQGLDAKKILSQFFTGTTLEKIDYPQQKNL